MTALLRIAGNDEMMNARRNRAAAVGLVLTSGAQYVHGGAGAFNQAIVRAIVRARIDAPGPNSTCMFAGPNDFGANGWAVIGAAYSGQPGALRGRLCGFGATGVFTDANLHIPADGETARYRTYEIWLDTVAGRMRLFCDGAEIGIGVATGAANLAIATGIGINTRPSALGTLGWGAMTIIEVQTSTTAPTRADIYNNAFAQPGTVVPGAQRLWVASDLGPAGAPAPGVWTDRLAATNLTIVGAPSLGLAYRNLAPVGTVEVYGDSIAAGRVPAGLQNEGWRRRVALNVSGAYRFLAFCGPNSFTDPATPLDFDARHRAVGGQALGVDTGVGTGLASLTAGVTANGSVDCVTYLGYGINDIVYRINTLGQTEAAAVAAYLVDLDAACAIIRGTRTAPILIQNILRVGVAAAGSNPTVRSSIQTLYAALPATIATLNTTYNDVYLVNAHDAVTPTQADADNVAILYDGIHETAAAKILHGDAVSPVLLAA